MTGRARHPRGSLGRLTIAITPQSRATPAATAKRYSQTSQTGLAPVPRTQDPRPVRRSPYTRSQARTVAHVGPGLLRKESIARLSRMPTQPVLGPILIAQ